MMLQFILNNQIIKTKLSAGMTVLDFVRYQAHLTGTKTGCREGDCGACAVLVGQLENDKLVYQSMTSCLMPLGNAHGKHIVTVEGINQKTLNPVQQAIVDEGGTQCGFCTVGFVMAFMGYALSEEHVNYTNTIAAIDGNICRCTGYKSLERAAQHITNDLIGKKNHQIIDWLIEKQFIPEYFKNIPQQLAQLNKTLVETNETVTVQQQIIGGGTDLYVQRPDSLLDIPVDFVFDKPAFNHIEQKDGKVYIGASTTVTDFREHPIIQKIFPKINHFTKLVSSTPIRNMATIAGNFINASPIGDMTIFFLALDASIVLNENGHKRTLALKDFYKGYKKMDKAEDATIETIFFDIPNQSTQFNFEKVCKRTHLDIATVNTAIQIEVQNNTIVKAHVAAGGVAPIPLYLKACSTYLAGKPLNAAAIRAANDILQEEIAPISDVRGSSDYKRLLLRQLFYAHFVELFDINEAL